MLYFNLRKNIIYYHGPECTKTLTSLKNKGIKCAVNFVSFLEKIISILLIFEKASALAHDKQKHTMDIS